MGKHRLTTSWLFLFALTAAVARTEYYGREAGPLRTQVHGVQGTVYIADERTLFIKGFYYDGQGPDAFFWGDTTDAPTVQGFIIPDENGSADVLKEYRGQNLILRLPEGRTLKGVQSLAVWCRKFAVNFGSVSLPSDDFPSPKSLGPLPTLAHGVRSDDVVIQDARTLLVTNLFYDGAGPDAFFMVGNGTQPHPEGIKVPDEDGRLEKLRGYLGKTVLLRMPGHLTVFDVDWFALYCIRYRHNFGHVMIPERPNVPANMEDLQTSAAGATTMKQALQDGSKTGAGDQYYGMPLGLFKTNAHDVSGEVFSASEDTFYVTNFHYDGQGPDAYFWAGTTDRPSPEGFIVPDELGTMQVLGKYTGQNIALTLPNGKKISDIKWLSVWCRRFTVNFGHINIPENFQPPRPVNLGPLSSLAHGVRSSDVLVKDARTIFIRGLHYDGAGPDAFFLVGSGLEPHPDGTKVPDENGSLDKLHGYTGQNVEIRLPEHLTVLDVDWLALYCIRFRQNFGHVILKGRMAGVPADLRSLRAAEAQDMRFENCEELFPGVLHVSWKIAGQDLILQMAGRVEENEYLSFGRSGHEDRSAMVGADVAVAFFDSELGKARVVDYFLSAKSQCSRGSGACPDEEMQGTDDVQLLSWQRTDGVFTVNFKRPVSARDGQDLSLPLSVPVSVVAAVGPLNSQKQVAYHTRYYNKDAKKIHFGRIPAQDRCAPLAPPKAPQQSGAWEPLSISGTTTFVAQIGPTGGDKGYTAITGSQSWGIAWWINGLLIPEITVRRGTNYTFLVEGGQDPSNSARHHPFYITNNPEGGGGHFLDQIGTPNHTVYAGILIDQNQRVIPSGAGRYCEWKHLSTDQWEGSPTFEDYKRTLKLECDAGGPGVVTWMPDEDTPNLVYYQCFLHRNLGWKIRVVDANAPMIDARMGQFMEGDSSTPSSAPGKFTPALLLLVILLSVIVSFQMQHR